MKGRRTSAIDQIERGGQRGIKNLGHEPTLDQEGELLDRAFLVSSALEMLTTTRKVDDSLHSRERSTLLELTDFMRKLKTADTYLTDDNSRLALQPDTLELVDTIRKGGNARISSQIDDALQFFEGVLDTGVLLVSDESEVDQISEFLRSVLWGLRVRLSSMDESRTTFL